MIITVSAPRGARVDAFFWALAVDGARVVRAPRWSAHRHDPLLFRAAVYAWHAIVGRMARREPRTTWYVEGTPRSHDAVHGHNDAHQPLSTSLRMASAYHVDCDLYLLVDARPRGLTQRHAHDLKALWGLAMQRRNNVRTCVL